MKPTFEQLEALQMQFWIQLQKLESSFQLANKKLAEQGAGTRAATGESVTLPARTESSTNTIHSEMDLEVQFAEQFKLILTATEELLKGARTWNQEFTAKMVELSGNENLQGTAELSAAISKAISTLRLQSILVNFIGRNESLDNLDGIYGRDFSPEILSEILGGQATCEKPGAGFYSHNLPKILAGCAVVSAVAVGAYFAAPYVGSALMYLAAASKGRVLRTGALALSGIAMTLRDINDLRKTIDFLIKQIS